MQFDSQPLLGKATGVKANVAGDTFVPFPIGDKRVVLTHVILSGASVDLSTSTSVLGAYTSTGRSGTALFTAAAYFGSLSSSSVVVDIVATVGITQSTALTAGGVYVNLSSVTAPAGTFDISFQGIVL